MTESQKLFNWITCLVLTLVFLAGFVAFALFGAVIAQAMPILGGSMILVGFASIATAFYSLQLMDRYV